MTIKPRDYQIEAHEAARKAWGAGMQRPAVVMPTGSGKTVPIATVAEEELREGYSTRVLVLAHRDELIRQAKNKIHSVAPHLRVGICKAGEDQVGAPIVVGSVQTLRHESRRSRVRNVGLVIVDECFPAGTLVGGRPIETLTVGDRVPSWDEQTGREVQGTVTAVMRRRPQEMVRVVTADGMRLDCTPGHPILTEYGWCPAGRLWRGALVLSFAHDATATLMHGMSSAGGSVDSTEVSDGRLPEKWTGVLQYAVSRLLGGAGPVSADGSDESSVRVGADDRAESDGAPRGTGEDGGFAPSRWAQATIERWQRETDSAAATGVSPDAWVADGGDDRTAGWPASVPLQGGYSAPGDDGIGRGGRGIPLLAGAPRVRPAPGRAAYARRVDSVQVLEPGSDGTYRGVCPDGYVYNIEVAQTHTYLVGAEGIVTHNCHHATAASYRTILDHYGCFAPGGARALGFTATMSRGDGVGLGEVWQDVVYERDIRYMITRRFLVPPRGISVRVEDLDLSKVRRSGSDYSEGQLGEALAQSMAPERIVDAYREHAIGVQALLFVPTVEFASLMVERFTSVGIRARLVHGGQTQTERDKALNDFRAGRVDILTNCMVLTEGTDLPMAGCVIIGRPTTHAGLYVQMVGRALRTHPGKTEAIVLDVVGASRRHALAGLVDLLGERDSEREESDRVPNVDDDAAEDERATREQRDRAWLDGFLVSEEVDLFHGQRARWQRTYGGHWFAPYGKEHIVAVVPALSGSPAWDVLRVHNRRPGESDWIAREIDDLGYAMAHGEGVVLQLPVNLARRNATWRKGPASTAQKEQLRRYGSILPEGATCGEASDVLSVIFASGRLDGRVPAARP